MDTTDPSEPRRILVVSPWRERWSLGDGAGVSDDYRFIEKLTRSGFELHFLVPRGEDVSGPAPDNFFLHSYANFFEATSALPTALKRLLWPTLFNIIVTVRTLQLVRRIRPHFVLGHSHYSSFPCYVARELFRVPTGVKLFGVMDLVHTEWPEWKYLFKNFEQIAALKIPQDVWIILDDGTRGDEAARRHGVPRERIQFLPNGINTEWANTTYDGAAIRAEFDIDSQACVVLFLARLVASKRPEMLVRAIPEVRQRTKRPLVFLFVGDGETRRSCEDLARNLGVDDSVRWLGAIPHARVPEIMSASDMFVSTSRLTNVAIPTCEAMVCGLPVVAFDVGNTRDIIHDDDTGLVVPNDDISALGRAIARLAGDDALRERMGAAAQTTASERFTSWDERIATEIGIMTALIEGHPFT